MGSQKHRPDVNLSHRIGYGAFRMIEWVIKLIPIELVCVLGGIFGSLGIILLPSRRYTVCRNLRIALGEQATHSQLRLLAWKTFWNSGANFMAAIRANAMTAEQLCQHMEVSGVEHIRKAQEQEKGIILLLAHMGNWESLTRMNLMVSGLDPFGGLYRPLNNPLLDRLIKRRREGTGTKLFSRKDGFFAPIAHLKKGGCLGVFADQNAGKHGLAVPMFGKLTSLTSLPALLHRRTGAPIVPVSMCSTSPGHWEIIAHPALVIDGDTKKSAFLTTMRCANAFENIMLESPTDVLWMHGYWKVGRKFPFKVDGTQKLLDANSCQVGKPFRLLVFTGSANSQNQEIAQAIQRLSNYRQDIEIITAGEKDDYPQAIHHIHISPGTPPHMGANRIVAFHQNNDTLIDCLIDLTPDGEGRTILRLSNIRPHFAATGPTTGTHRTRKHLERTNQTLDDVLVTLGIDINKPQTPHQDKP